MPLKPRSTWIATVAAMAVLAALCLGLHFATRDDAELSRRWPSIVPPLVAVTLALITGRIFISLGAGVFIGGFLAARTSISRPLDFWMQGVGDAERFVVETVFDLGNFAPNADNLLVLAFVVLVMMMIAVMLAGGGLQGVADWLMRFARSRRSTQLVTMAAGWAIFLDDYANTMIVGSTFRPMTDRQRISREKLAFLVDATAAPIAGIAIVSTWVGVEAGYLGGPGRDLGIAQSGYVMFLDALAFRFYCIGMLGFVVFNAFSGRDFGPMAAAERRAHREGKVLADDARPMTSGSLTATVAHPAARVRASVAVLPMVTLVAVFLASLWICGGFLERLASDPLALLRLSQWRQVLGEVNSFPLLAYASAWGLWLAVALTLAVARVPWPAIIKALGTGIRGSLVPMGVLVLAWSLKGACDALGTGSFMASVLREACPPMLFPALVFVVAAGTSFATGTSWGTMAILIPIAVPVAFALDGEYGRITMISIAAVLDGAIFGDHCSPISDTTIMSSAASACDHVAHVRTQMPYSLAVAGIALCVGYLPAALGSPRWAGIVGAIAATGLVFLLLPRTASPTAGRISNPSTRP